MPETMRVHASDPGSDDLPSPPPAVTESATWALRELSRDLRTAVDQALDEAPEPVSLRGYWLLETVAAGEPRAQRELGDALGVDRSDMVRLVDSLEQAGLVQRTRDDADRRRRLIAPTDAGKAARRSLRRRLAAAEAAVLSAAGDATARALRLAADAAGAAGDSRAAGAEGAVAKPGKGDGGKAKSGKSGGKKGRKSRKRGKAKGSGKGAGK